MCVRGARAKSSKNLEIIFAKKNSSCFYSLLHGYIATLYCKVHTRVPVTQGLKEMSSILADH
jgi:hypothetical protein